MKNIINQMPGNFAEFVAVLSNYIGWGVIFLAIYFFISAALGVIRFSGFYAKMHAISIADSVGLPLFFLGLVFIRPELGFSLRCLIIIILTLILAPTSAHALVKAGWYKSAQKEKRG